MNTRPNILLICSDQHNPAITGCYGNEVVDTPSIDRLARDGAIFDAAYCSQPICVPSRMSFMTGRYPHAIEVFSNGDVLDSRIPTFAHVATGADYRTVLAGRMHFVGPDQYHGYQEHIGSDYTAYAFHTGKINKYEPLPGLLGNGGLPDPLVTVGAGKTCTQDLDKDTTVAALRWLDSYSRSGDRRPFMMTVGYFSPHCPYIVERAYFEKYIDRVEPIVPDPDELATLHPYHRAYREKVSLDEIPEENLRKATAAYYGLVDFLDDQIEQLLARLEELRLGEDTMVVYFSDHGEMLGEHGRWHKMTFYESSSRVPLIVSGAAVGRERIAAPVSLLDVFPTVCDTVGVDPWVEIDGRSLFSPHDPDRPILCEFHDDHGSHRMIRRGRFKLSVYAGSDRRELFDIHDDPDEKENLSGLASYGSIERELHALASGGGWSGELVTNHRARMRRIGFEHVSSSMKKTEELIADGTITDIPGYDPAVSHYENSLDA